MATHYVDPAAGGANDGTSWTDAWTDLQSACDNAADGDTVYCRGTQTLASTIDNDVTPGIIFIGCNGGGSVDGTRFVLDGNSAVNNVLMTNQNRAQFINFEIKNSINNGLNPNAAWYNIFINCIFHTNGRDGVHESGTSYYLTFVRCKFYNNTLLAIDNSAWGYRYYFCAFYGNGSDGIDTNTSSVTNTVIGCIFHDNGNSSEHIHNVTSGSSIYFNVLDGTDMTSGVGTLQYNYVSTFIGNRVTNLTTGFNIFSRHIIYGWNYFHNNTNDTINDTYAITLPYASDQDTNEADVDADDGFNDVSSDDFNLKLSRELRREGVSLNLGSTTIYLAAGLIPKDSGADTGSSLFYITAGLPPDDSTPSPPGAEQPRVCIIM